MKFGAIHTPRPVAIAPLAARATLAETIIPDWFAKWPSDDDPLGNDRWGCCVPAADHQIVRLWGGRADRHIVLDRYQRMTGFDPATGSPDLGTDTTADMSAWCAAPIIDSDGTPFPAFWASINHANSTEIRRALARFPLLLTINCPDPDIYPPETWGLPPHAWTAVATHRIVLGNLTGAGWRVRTWGSDYDVHPDLMSQWLLAVDVPIPHPASVGPELSWDDMDYVALAADIAALETAA